MTSRPSAVYVFFLIPFFLLAPSWAAPESGKDIAADIRPNFIIIIADDLGYEDTGIYGATRIPTPHLNRLADASVRFSRGYVTHSICAPSRAGLLTGQYQGRFGYDVNPSVSPYEAKAGIPVDVENIAEMLSSAGYATHAIGKWHVGTHVDLRPTKRGFDTFFGFLSGGHRYFPEELTLERLEDSTFHLDWYRTRILENETPIRTEKYLTEEFTDRAVKIIDESDDQPFFIYLSYNAPHAPLQAPDKYLQRFSDVQPRQLRTYMAMVSALDDGVGEVMAALAKKGIAENTVVVFLSDNGGVGGKSSNAPLRGYKRDLFEGGIRVPFVMRVPGFGLENVRFEKPVSSLDIAPTLAGLAAIDRRDQWDGVNLMPFITGADRGLPHEYLFWRRFETGEFAILEGSGGKGLWVTEGELFYNLDVDPFERQEVTLEKSEMSELRRQVDQWRNQLQDPDYSMLRTWLPPRPEHSWYTPDWVPGQKPDVQQ